MILLLPALADIKAALPEAKLTLLTGERCADVAKMCPAINEVMVVDRVAMRDGPVVKAVWGMMSLARELRRRRFDLVVDFHSFRETNLLTWVSRAKWRFGMKRHGAAYWSWCFNTRPVLEDKRLHVGEMFRRVVQGIPGLPSPGPAATLSPSHESGRRLLITDDAAGDEPRLALYVDAPAPERVWPPERFAEVADFAIENWGVQVVVLSGREGEPLAERVKKASRNANAIATFTNVAIPQLAGLIASSRLLISNDTGPMHLGPALDVPTLGLFSVGYPEHFRPTGPQDKFLRANPIDKIEVKGVIEVMEQMWAIADRDLRR